MARGKRAESNGLKEHKAKRAKKADPEAVEAQSEDAGSETESPPEPGHNSAPRELTDDERAALTGIHKRSYVAALAAKKAADAALKNVAKLAKAELGANAVADIKDMIALETPEGEAALKAEVERKLRIAKWMGLTVGAQTDLFAEADMGPAVDRFAARGKKDGLAGDQASPQCDETVPQYAAYMNAYHEGQRTLFNIKALPPAAAEPDDSELDDLPDAPVGDEPPTPEGVALQ